MKVLTLMTAGAALALTAGAASAQETYVSGSAGLNL